MRLSDYGYHDLLIETQRGCNMTCQFCSASEQENKTARLTADEVYQVINSIDPTDPMLDGIYLHKFNEPLLDPRIFDFIRYAKDRSLKVFLTTNGLRLGSKEIRRNLLAAKPDRIKVSLQTLNERTFAVRGAGIPFQNYKRILHTFLNEARGKPSEITLDVACNFLSGDTLSRTGTLATRILGIDRGDPSIPDTVQEIRMDLIKFLWEFYADVPAIDRFLETAGWDYNTQTPLPLAENIFLKIKKFDNGHRMTRYYPVLTMPPCTSTSLAIDAEGFVAPCCLTYNDMIRLGNIRTDPLEKILKRSGEVVAQLRAGTSPFKVCRRCTGQPTRRGALVASSYWTLKKKVMK